MNKKLVSIDGNTAAAYVAYAMSEIAAIYPITPSSTMAEVCDEWAAKDRKNIFGHKLEIREMQSEAGAAGAVHGAATAGALSVTFTASQGLLLMIPNMYKLAGEMLPSVFHVSARALASHALNIFGDHQDVMACRQTGFCMLASNNVQEAMDLGFISHIASLKSSLPFLHFFDGFRTSHEINKVEEIPYDTMREMVPVRELKNFRERGHNPEHPKLTGTAQNGDTYFQNREGCNIHYENVYDIVNETMKEFALKTGRKYQPFEFYGHEDATHIIVMMGSGADTASEVVDYYKNQGKKYGVLKVHLYRPFNCKAFVEKLPKNVNRITVLDRTKEPGALGEPLYLDVVMALNQCGNKNIEVVGGRYGLGGKDFTPSNIISVFENMEHSKPKNHFSVGINDDVNHTSLPEPVNFAGLKDNNYECKFWGLGSDGTVSANKSSIKIIGDFTEKHTQAYFEYDSKKSGGLTTSHLRISDEHIKSPYLLQAVDFIGIHNFTYITKYDTLKGLKQNGSVLINSPYSAEEIGHHLPKSFKDTLVEKQAKVYVIDANKVAFDAGLGNKINVIMQSCFFKITNIIPYEQAEKSMKDSAIKAYGKKGEKVIEANMKAIDAAVSDLREVNVAKMASQKTVDIFKEKKMSDYYKRLCYKVECARGNELKTSDFNADGSVPTATTQYEKRNINQFTPKWMPEKCIQCGQCTLVCPHAAVRSLLLSKEEVANAPETFKTANALGAKDAQFRIQISSMDCSGCGSCAKVCPAKEKALVMVNNSSPESVLNTENANWEYSLGLKQLPNSFNKNTVKGLQFEMPYFEFSGACAGCGETPYIKAITQMFGDRMVIANATGCSSIYGGSSPTVPYCVNKAGHGPTWANSLFEDNAEFGYGMQVALNFRRQRALDHLEYVLTREISANLKQAIEAFLTNKDNALESKKLKRELVLAAKDELKNSPVNSDVDKIIENEDLYVKKSTWIVGGDGWAYDIGFGGLDHVIASGADVNILVMDTEVYSNTGGQASKATPMGSIAKFAADGKHTRKKDLGAIAMTYKDVYVAQVAMGADQNQFLKALIEAESYKGPSIIIAYAPCINHGIDMSNAQAEMKKAVLAGYWPLYRYDPRTGKLTIDSADPTASYQDFVKSEARYASLFKKDPETATKLFAAAEAQAKDRLENLKKLQGICNCEKTDK